MKTPRHILIIGASSDLARAVIPVLAGAGLTVSQASRATLGGDYAAADWPKIFAEVEKAAGLPCDAVLHIPGYAAFGAATTIPAEEARKTFEANFWLLTATAAAANAWWAGQRRPGHFWAVLSLAALRAIPGEAWYAASKAAAARWLETLDLEQRGAGRRFRYFCPGKFASKFRRNSGASETDSGSSLASVAHAIARSVTSGTPGRVIGWKENAIVLADRLFPGLYDRLILERRISS